MDIAEFLNTEIVTEESRHVDSYKDILSKITNRDYIDTSQYAYFLDFVHMNGTISNAEWFLKQIETITGTTNDKSKTNLEKPNLMKEFRQTIGRVFNNFFKYDEEQDQLRINKNIRYYLTRLDTINLTSEQKKAMQSLYEFLIDYKRSVFGLYGYAGSGKTTTVVEFVSYMMANKYLNSVAFTAPTNKAVNVIKAKFKIHLKKISETMFEKKLDDTFNFDDELDLLEQRGLVIKFMTVHKLLAFKTDYSIDGDTIFVRDQKQGSLISKFELVIIDECSMINMDMIDTIFEEIRNLNNPIFVSKKKVTKKRIKNANEEDSKIGGYIQIPKIVFTGDPAQLPPVNEEDSSIFCKNATELKFDTYLEAMSFKNTGVVTSNIVPILEAKYNILLDDLSRMETILLKNVVRSRLDIVTKVCHEFRKWIKQNKLPVLEQFVGQKGVTFFNNDERITKIQSDWFNKFLSSIKNGETSIIITWTNKQTDIYNETIRRHLFKGKQIKKFEEHDVLMLSEFYGLDLGEDFVKQKLYTSEQIKVIAAKQAEVPIRSFEPFINAGIRHMKQAVSLEDRVKTLIEGLNEMYCSNIAFNCWILKVKKFGEASDHNMTLIVVDDGDSPRYEKMKTESGSIIKNFSKQLLHQFRTGTKQIEKFIIKPLWKQWNKIFVDSFANVNYGYSITCHKAQGSSFYDVYVDLDDILLNSQRPVEAKKCAYTAATRASNELNLLI
jgi:hypothetical protein